MIDKINKQTITKIIDKINKKRINLVYKRPNMVKV